MDVESVPKKASRYSYPKNEPFCKHCGVLITDRDIWLSKGRILHFECGKQIRFDPIPSNRASHLKPTGDSLPI
jgi:hypothetical protein